MSERNQFSLAAGAHRELLLGPGSLASGVEHLRPGECQFDRSLHQLRGRGREQRVAPLKSFRAEGTADKWTDDAHILERHTKSVRDNFLELFDSARALMNAQTVRRLNKSRSDCGSQSGSCR